MKGIKLRLVVSVAIQMHSISVAPSIVNLHCTYEDVTLSVCCFQLLHMARRCSQSSVLFTVKSSSGRLVVLPHVKFWSCYAEIPSFSSLMRLSKKCHPSRCSPMLLLKTMPHASEPKAWSFSTWRFRTLLIALSLPISRRLDLAPQHSWSISIDRVPSFYSSHQRK